MDHQLFLTNGVGGSIELVEFFCELQNQNLQRYYYILENKLCWRDSLEAVAQEILMIDKPRRYKGYHYWTILCQAKWKDGIFTPLTLKVFSLTLVKYLMKHRYSTLIRDRMEWKPVTK